MKAWKIFILLFHINWGYVVFSRMVDDALMETGFTHWYDAVLVDLFGSDLGILLLGWACGLVLLLGSYKEFAEFLKKILTYEL